MLCFFPYPKSKLVFRIRSTLPHVIDPKQNRRRGRRRGRNARLSTPPSKQCVEFVVSSENKRKRKHVRIKGTQLAFFCFLFCLIACFRYVMFFFTPTANVSHKLLLTQLPDRLKQKQTKFYDDSIFLLDSWWRRRFHGIFTGEFPAIPLKLFSNEIRWNRERIKVVSVSSKRFDLRNRKKTIRKCSLFRLELLRRYETEN